MSHRSLVSITVLTFLVLASCQALKPGGRIPFRVDDARHYSWFVNDRERGVNIEIEVSRLKGDMLFESVVFQNRKIPLATVIRDKSVLLKAVIPGPESVLSDPSVLFEGPDQLLFICNGVSSSAVLEFRREAIQYIKAE